MCESGDTHRMFYVAEGRRPESDVYAMRGG